jgi:hypothetical protein
VGRKPTAVTTFFFVKKKAVQKTNSSNDELEEKNQLIEMKMSTLKK